MRSKEVFVVGNGMTAFEKPSKTAPHYELLIKQAVERCLRDANVPYSAIQQAYVGYVYGDSCGGQRGLYEVGISGIPIINVNNNCCTGSTALFLGVQAIKSGQAECVLAVGFDKMNSGALKRVFSDRTYPLDLIMDKQTDVLNSNGKLIKGAPQIFGNAAIEYM